MEQEIVLRSPTKPHLPMKPSITHLFCSAITFLLLFSLPHHAHGQEYSVRAIDADTGKPIPGIPITLRYECTVTGSGIKTKMHCQFIQRRTGADGVARFPEAGTLSKIDDIYSLPIAYDALCCDISQPVVPGVGTINFKKRSLSEILHWIFVGD